MHVCITVSNSFSTQYVRVKQTIECCNMMYLIIPNIYMPMLTKYSAKSLSLLVTSVLCIINYHNFLSYT